jgi:hypothetical protein
MAYFIIRYISIKGSKGRVILTLRDYNWLVWLLYS